MALLDQNKLYNFINRNSNKYMDVSNGSTSNGAKLVQYSQNNLDSQIFQIFPCDYNYYIIVNKNSGRLVDVENNSTANNAPINQWDWQGSEAQLWFLHEKKTDDNVFYNIDNKKSGKYIGVHGRGTSNNNPLTQYQNQDLDFQQWKAQAVGSPLILPSIPIENLNPVPILYNIDDVPPESTNFQVIAYTLAPFFSVRDPHYGNDYPKQYKENPYYLYIKEQRWVRTNYARLSPNEQRSYSYVAGMTQTNQETVSHTVSHTVGADAGLQFGKESKSINSSLQYSWTESLETTISNSIEEMQQNTYEIIVANTSNNYINWGHYILETRYSIKRTNGSVVNTPWTLRDPASGQSTSYPVSIAYDALLSPHIIGPIKLPR